MKYNLLEVIQEETGNLNIFTFTKDIEFIVRKVQDQRGLLVIFIHYLRKK